MLDINRCPWCGTDPLYIAYHDEEWGVPVHEDAKLFEFLTLEGAQAGLSWITVLRKRENYRKHFHEWDIETIVNMSDEELESILQDPGIVRNRLKVYSVRQNARVALQIQQEFGSLDHYFWYCHFEEGGLPVRQTGNPEKKEIFFHVSESPRFARDDKREFPMSHPPYSMSDCISESDISRAISKDLKKRGMNFVGPTIISAFMQAVGMVDDHLDSCFRKRLA